VKIIVSASFLSYATNTISHIPIPWILNKRERAFWLLHTYMPVEFV
jgi:hypothetical protein